MRELIQTQNQPKRCFIRPACKNQQELVKHKLQEIAAGLYLTLHIFLTPAFVDNLAKRIMPKISKTEEAALQAGTVGFDGELFNGNPSLANLVKKYDVALRPEEKAFMGDQVEKLCALLDDYEVTRDRDMPENVWEYLKREKVNTHISMMTSFIPIFADM